MVLARIVPLAATLVLVTASLAGASAPERRGFGGSAEVDVEPGGTGTVTSGELPRSTFDADVYLNAPISDRAIFPVMVFAMMGVKSTSKRFAGCVLVAATAMKPETDEPWRNPGGLKAGGVQGTGETRSAAIALMCLRLAAMMAEIEAETPTRVARRACTTLPLDLKIRTERSADGGFVVTPTSGARDAGRRLAATARCYPGKGKLRVRLHAKGRKPLSTAVGRNLAVGVASPTSAASGASVTVGFKKR